MQVDEVEFACGIDTVSGAAYMWMYPGCLRRLRR